MAAIIQISDTHFGTEQPPVVDALVNMVRAQNPELVVLSGDITQRARAGQFHAARQFADRLHARNLLSIPGNHDIPLLDLATRIFRPYAKYQRQFGDDLEPVYESESLLVITLKTTRRYRHVDGEISQTQIDRVAALLKAAKPEKLRLVVTHQPVCVTRPQDEENLLHGHEAAVRAWSAAGADIIMGGHIHLPYVCALHESFTGLPQKTWAVQAGTAVSSRIRHEAGNSVNLIRYEGPQNDSEPDVIKVEQWDYQIDKRCFDIVRVHELNRENTGHGS